MESSTRSPSSRALALALAALLLPRPGFARPSASTTPPPTASSSSDAPAREKFEAARSAYDVGQFRRALQLYTEAYQLKSLPPFLFNIAQCHRLLGEYERAAFFYQRFLELAPDHPTVPMTRELLAEVRLAEQRRREGIAREREIALVSLELKRAEAQLAVQRQRAASDSVRESSLLSKWWVWTAAGVVTAGLAGALVFASSSPQRATLGSIQSK